MTQLETLLRRYAEGDITQEELQELNVLSHRDEVLAGAASRAKTLRRQRATKMSVVASVALVVAVVLTVALRTGSPAGVPDTVLEANAAPQPVVTAPIESPAEPAPVAVHQTIRPAVSREVAEAAPAVDEEIMETVAETLQETLPTVQVREAAPAPAHAEGYPVVACNSECSPDSVINDIWRFLRV